MDPALQPSGLEGMPAPRPSSETTVDARYPGNPRPGAPPSELGATQRYRSVTV
jgi:hypothetical protein